MATAQQKASLTQVVTKNREVSLDKIRNIGIIAHIDAGKTTTTERILFYTGRTYKLGSVDEGTTVTDWMEQERERGITIVSAAITAFWELKKESCVPKGEYRVNIIDTPGHVDFTAEVERSLRVLDGGITVLDAEEMVQSQTETVWRQADKYHVPRIIFINKMDKLGANFEGTLGAIKDRLGAKPVVLAIPIGSEQSFRGIILVLERKALIWEGLPAAGQGDDTGGTFKEAEVPEELRDAVEKHRAATIEAISETDEQLLEKYVGGVEPDVIELKSALRRATVKTKLFPTFCGSSLRNKGVQPLLDAVIEFLPSPVDLPPVKGDWNGEIQERKTGNEEPFSALAFKVQTDPHVGRLVWFRIYSGKMRAGQEIFNTVKNRRERIGRLVLMHANQRELIEEAYSGEIVAGVGFRETVTGDTVSDPAHPIVLESISFPEPVISLAIEPKTKADQEKLGEALGKLSEEDPTFRIKANQETGQTIISGMGELHLEILVDRMRREFNVDATTGAPQVAYKETVTGNAEGEGKYIRQTGGRGQYGHCLLRVEPKGRGEGYEFINKIKGGAIPGEFVSPIDKGVQEALANGILAGYPMTDLAVTVYDGSYHDVDSSEIAFKIAGSMAVQDAVKRAGMVLLEPIMKFEVTTPEEFMGDVIGDLSSRRAQILGTETRGNYRVILGSVPLAEISGYTTTLRSLTQGRASAYVEPSHYQEVPQNITNKIIEAKKS
ncbi:elongation factor G [Candidatus Microgenomates bacterium]|nr:elongation factor G [Candidatus Microgenomates bacterium]